AAVSASCAMAGRPATSIVAAKARAVRWKAAGLDMGIPGLVGARMLDRSAGNPGEGGPDGSAAVQRCPRDAKPERNRNADARGRTRLRPKKKLLLPFEGVQLGCKRSGSGLRPG